MAAMTLKKYVRRKEREFCTLYVNLFLRIYMSTPLLTSPTVGLKKIQFGKRFYVLTIVFSLCNYKFQKDFLIFGGCS